MWGTWGRHMVMDMDMGVGVDMGWHAQAGVCQRDAARRDQPGLTRWHVM